MTGILERLFTRRQESATKAALSWLDLVAGVAADRMTEDEIESTLAELGKSLEALRAAVQLVKDREGWQNQAGELQTLQRDANAVEAAITQQNQEFNQRLKQLHQQHSEDTQALESQRRILVSKINLATDAQSKLLATRPEHIRRASDEVSGQIQARLAEIRKLQNDAGEFKSSGRSSYMHRDDSDEKRIAVLRIEIASLQKKVDAIESGAVR